MPRKRGAEKAHGEGNETDDRADRDCGRGVRDASADAVHEHLNALEETIGPTAEHAPDWLAGGRGRFATRSEREASARWAWDRRGSSTATRWRSAGPHRGRRV